MISPEISESVPGCSATPSLGPTRLLWAFNGTRPVLDPRANLARLYAPLNRWEGRLEVNGQVIYRGMVVPGMLRLSTPDDAMHSELPSSASAVILEFPVARLTELFSRHGYDHRPQSGQRLAPLLQRQVAVHRLVQALEEAVRFQGSARQCFLDGILEAMIGVLLEGQLRPGPPGPAAPSTLSDVQFAAAVAYADARIGRRLSVDEWAEFVGLSTAEFARRFYARTSDSPYAWFVSRRIEHAKQRLQTSHAQLAELALALGFSSQSHFTEMFRRRTGTSPAAWRNSQRHQG